MTSSGLCGWRSAHRPARKKGTHLLHLAENERLVGAARDHLEEAVAQHEAHRRDRRRVVVERLHETVALQRAEKEHHQLVEHGGAKRGGPAEPGRR